MAYETLRFTLADPHLGHLKALMEGDESIHLVAKRLLIETLVGETSATAATTSAAIPDDLVERITAIEQSLKQLASQPAATTSAAIPDDLVERITAIEAAIKELSAVCRETKNNYISDFLALRDEIESLETKMQSAAPVIPDDLVERVTAIESSLRDERERLTTAILGDLLEVIEERFQQLASQPAALPPVEKIESQDAIDLDEDLLEPKLSAQILTDKEVSELLEVSNETARRYRLGSRKMPMPIIDKLVQRGIKIDGEKWKKR